MRDVTASAAYDGLVAAVRPFLERAIETVPVLSVPGVGASVLLQRDPLIARLVVEGPATACEAMHLVGPEIPNQAQLDTAVELFLGAGLSGLPPAVVDGVVDHAAKDGAGLIVWLRPLEGCAACYLAPSRVPLTRAERLFSVEVGASPAEPSGPVTVH